VRKGLILKFLLFFIVSVCGAIAQFNSQQQTDSQQQPDRQSIPGMSVPRPSTGVSITNLGQGGSAADRELLREDWTTIISQFVLGAAAAKVLFP
jgi:hypothetical protein